MTDGWQQLADAMWLTHPAALPAIKTRIVDHSNGNIKFGSSVKFGTNFPLKVVVVSRSSVVVNDLKLSTMHFLIATGTGNKYCLLALLCSDYGSDYFFPNVFTNSWSCICSSVINAISHVCLCVCVSDRERERGAGIMQIFHVVIGGGYHVGGPAWTRSERK